MNFSTLFYFQRKDFFFSLLFNFCWKFDATAHFKKLQDKVVRKDVSSNCNFDKTVWYCRCTGSLCILNTIFSQIDTEWHRVTPATRGRGRGGGGQSNSLLIQQFVQILNLINYVFDHLLVTINVNAIKIEN